MRREKERREKDEKRKKEPIGKGSGEKAGGRIS